MTQTISHTMIPVIISVNIAAIMPTEIDIPKISCTADFDNLLRIISISFLCSSIILRNSSLEAKSTASVSTISLQSLRISSVSSLFKADTFVTGLSSLTFSDILFPSDKKSV